MYLSLGLDKAAGCEQNVFEKHLDVSHIHLNLLQIVQANKGKGFKDNTTVLIDNFRNISTISSI